MNTPIKCDLFCRVIDNYGDAAICLRLSKQLAENFGCKVRLIIDNVDPLFRLCPKIEETNKIIKTHNLLSIIHWHQNEHVKFEGANLVIEAFACTLDDHYINELAEFAKTQHLAWVNLEYLSAETWIDKCHLQKSPHPTLPLCKTFFFPGFTNQSGGLLRDRETQNRQPSTHKQRKQWWQSHGLIVHKNTIFVSVFCYEKAPLLQLINSSHSQKKYHFIFFLTDTVSTNKLTSTFSKKTKLSLVKIEKISSPYNGLLKINSVYKISSTCTCVTLPFLNQGNYDNLLWHCDFNFIRGEDSFVRAQWAAQPFCWNIYPQSNEIHRKKLDAFLDRISQNLNPTLKTIIYSFWYIWNFHSDADLKKFTSSWINLIDHLEKIHISMKLWRQHLFTQPDLASQLMDFYKNSCTTI